MNAPATWGRAFPYRPRPGEELEEKCARIMAELAECARRRQAAIIDFTEPRRDQDESV